MIRAVNGRYTLLVFMASASAAAALPSASEWKALCDRGTEAYQTGRDSLPSRYRTAEAEKVQVRATGIRVKTALRADENSAMR